MSDATSLTQSRASAHSMAFYSSTPGTSLWSGESDVDRDGFLKSLFRAGGPVLCSLPSAYAPISRAYDQRTKFNDRRSEILNQASAILSECDISYSKITATGLISRIKSEPEAIPTVLAIMPHRSPPESGRWLKAARRIHAKLSPQFPGISVDLIDANLMKIPYCFPLSRSHSIIPKWEGICREILRISNCQEWTGIACWRYGVEPTPSDNPVTLIVSVLESATGPFTTSLRRIKDILAVASERHVDILFMKNEPQSHHEEPKEGLQLLEEICSRSVQPGVSIGIQDSLAGTSTLGGIVELKFRNDSTWYPYGLTCFHCVYPPRPHRSNFSTIKGASNALDFWEFNPISPGDKMARQLLRIEQPSTFDLRNSITYADASIRSLQNDTFRRLHAKAGPDEIIGPEKALYQNTLRFIESFQQQKNVYQKFLDDGSQKLGYVYAGSGYDRTIDMSDGLTRLSDWALIQISCERLPAGTDLYERNKPFRYNLKSDPPPFLNPTNERLVAQDELFKTGRSTMRTRGYYNEIKDISISRVKDLTRPEGFRIVTTWEHSVSSTDPFAKPGDSGSFVYTLNGCVVGMLFSGYERLGTWNFSSMSDIFDDIKAITHAEDVRLPPPLE